MTGPSPTDMIFEFQANKLPGAFKINRTVVANGLFERIRDPSKIGQGSSSLCGPAALLYTIARSDPKKYVQFAINLYESGSASLGKLLIDVKGEDVTTYTPPKSDIHPVDWMTLASIRDSETWFFDYHSETDKVAGITMPSSLEDWFRKAGYTEIINETNIFLTKDEVNARKASDLYKKAYNVSLFINALMLDADKHDEDSWTPDHWVVLTSPITITENSIMFFIFTWGTQSRVVPRKGSLSKKSFLNNYYGFIACKH
jgi:hypothetical protein